MKLENLKIINTRLKLKKFFLINHLKSGYNNFILPNILLGKRELNKYFDLNLTEVELRLLLSEYILLEDELHDLISIYDYILLICEISDEEYNDQFNSNRMEVYVSKYDTIIDTISKINPLSKKLSNFITCGMVTQNPDHNKIIDSKTNRTTLYVITDNGDYKEASSDIIENYEKLEAERMAENAEQLQYFDESVRMIKVIAELEGRVEDIAEIIKMGRYIRK